MSSGRLPDKRVTSDGANAIPARFGLILVGYWKDHEGLTWRQIHRMAEVFIVRSGCADGLPWLAMAEPFHAKTERYAVRPHHQSDGCRTWE